MPVQVNRVGSMLTVFFSASRCSTRRARGPATRSGSAAFFHALLENGVYFPPSQFEAAFLSTAHNQDDVDRTLRAAKVAFAAAAKA